MRDVCVFIITHVRVRIWSKIYRKTLLSGMCHIVDYNHIDSCVLSVYFLGLFFTDTFPARICFTILYELENAASVKYLCLSSIMMYSDTLEYCVCMCVFKVQDSDSALLVRYLWHWLKNVDYLQCVRVGVISWNGLWKVFDQVWCVFKTEVSMLLFFIYFEMFTPLYGLN